MKIALLSSPLLRALALSGALVFLVSNLLPWRGEEGPLLAWEEMNEGIKLQASIVSLVFAEEASRTLYAATYDPGGVYRSGEGGLSWRKIAAGLEKHTILSLAVPPGNGETLFAGAVDGAFVTRDEGVSWRAMEGGLPATNVYAWAFVGDGPVTVYVATDSGLYASGDGGETWESVRGLLGEVPTLCVVADPFDAGRLYAGTAGEGLYLSADRGVSWLAIEEVGDSSSVTALVVGAKGEVYALVDHALWVGFDRGRPWRALDVGGNEAPLISLAVDRSRGTLYVGAYRAGGFWSGDCGDSWQGCGEELAKSSILCWSIHPEGEALWAGTQFYGLYRSTDGGSSWHIPGQGIGERRATALAADPSNPERLFLATAHGVYLSEDRGASWARETEGMGALRILDVAVSPWDGTVYAAGVYRLERGVEIWEMPGEGIRGLTSFCLSFDRCDSGKVYAGTWGNNLCISGDRGGIWRSVHGGLETLSVRAFVIDPGDPSIWYVGTVEGAYRSLDGGNSWEACGLEKVTVFALLADSDEPGELYAGTTDGVYRTRDRGGSWEAWMEGMEPSTIRCLAWSLGGELLYAGAEGRGVYARPLGAGPWMCLGLEGPAIIYDLLVSKELSRLYAATSSGVYGIPLPLPSR